MSQLLSELSQEDEIRIEAQRKWVRGHFEPASEHLYVQLDQKLRLLDTIIKNQWIEPAETAKLQSLGITLGDAIAQKLGFRWIVVEDEYGRDPALRYKGTSIVLFPLTMISKRVERGEAVDVRYLFDIICSKVQEQISIQDSNQSI